MATQADTGQAAAIFVAARETALRWARAHAGLLAMFAVFTGFFFGAALLMHLEFGSARDLPFPANLCLFDCTWYQQIAEDGYHLAPKEGRQGLANWAFWPLFPLLAAIVSALTGLGYEGAGVVVNNAALLGTLLLLWDIRRALGLSDKTFLAFAALFLASPAILYLRIPYSEAVFNFFLALAVWGWVKNRNLTLAVAGLALSIARGGGVLLPVILAGELVWRHRFNIKALLDEDFGRVAAISVMPLGFLFHAWSLWAVMGDPLAFTHVHAAWQAGDWRNPVETFVQFFIVEPRLAEQIGLVLAVIAVALCTRLARQNDALRPAAILFIVLTLIAIALTPRSYGRYAFAYFLPYIPLAAMLAETRFLRPAVGALFIAQLIVIALWSNGAGFLV